MSDIGKMIRDEGNAAEAAELGADVARRDVTVARGHERSRVLQIRLNEDELADIAALAESEGLPVSTVARSLILQALRPSEDLKGAFDQLERDLSLVRRRALSA